MEVIADARARGAAVLVSTHLRELAVQACEDALVLRGGSAVAAVQRRTSWPGRRVPVPTAHSSTEAGPRARAVADLARAARASARAALRDRAGGACGSAGRHRARPHRGRDRRAGVPRRAARRARTRTTFVAMLPTALPRRSWPSPISPRRRVRRRPRAVPREQAVAFPVTTDHRPPRRAAAGAAQHRLADADLDAARAPRRTSSGPRRAPAAAAVRCCCGWRAPPRSARRRLGLRVGPPRDRTASWSSGCSPGALAGRRRRARADRPARAGCWTAARPCASPSARSYGARTSGRRGRRRSACSLLAAGRGHAARRSWPARWAPARRAPREELRLETRSHRAAADPGSRPARMVRIDRVVDLALGAAAPRAARAGLHARAGRRRRAASSGAR